MDSKFKKINTRQFESYRSSVSSIYKVRKRVISLYFKVVKSNKIGRIFFQMLKQTINIIKYLFNLFAHFLSI